MPPKSAFDETTILQYLGLPDSYDPSPSVAPIEFLLKHLRQLPPHLSSQFSLITVPKQLTIVPSIRNRRLKFTQSNPRELSFAEAKNTWPTLWQGRERRGQREGAEERAWAEKKFMDGAKQEVGKLGTLLGGYEEERQAERVRILRRVEAESVPEEEEESEEEGEESEEEEYDANAPEEEETEEEARASFGRRIKEKFIYGLLESSLYGSVDWDERYDTEDDRDTEERWFDEEEESMME